MLGAILAATDLAMDGVEQALIAQHAENEYVGVPTGLLDQLSILFAEERTAQLIDFRTLAARSVPFHPEASGLVLLLINSRAAHRHAGGEYAARRASCERAAAALGVSSLRDVQGQGTPVLAALPQPGDARRARHILTENQRVLDAVDALHASDFVEFGRLLTASQASMRDDFQITTEHIDLIADDRRAGGRPGGADDRRRLRRLCDRPGPH